MENKDPPVILFVELPMDPNYDSPFAQFGFEPDHPGPQVDPHPSRTAIIRTSDRITFRQCRRKWGWSSHLRGTVYGPMEHASPLWFGTGMHYALEDFHGLKQFQNSKEAFQAFVNATSRFSKHGGPKLPGDVQELIQLGHGMLNYYEHWLETRPPLTTFIWMGKPQVEVHVLINIDINLLPDWIKEHWDEVLYAATFDRVVVDEYNRLWIVEYKTAKRIEWFHLPTDPQVTAYCWLASRMYDAPIAGVIYQQHRKEIPEGPRVLADGRVSTQTSGTTYTKYRHTMQSIYGGNSDRWPSPNIDALNQLMKEENDTKDLFIQRDKVQRSQHQIEAEGTKVLLELEDMLNPNLPLYPNPNRMFCSWCNFQHACIDMDDGADWQSDLEMEFKPQPSERDTWRKYLVLPSQYAHSEAST